MQTQKLSSDYPKRGQLYVANLDPGFGREVHKIRPVLIISNNSLNKIADHVIIIPASSIVPYILSDEMVSLGKPESFDQESVLLPLYIRSIDKERLIKKLGRISKGKLSEVENCLKLVLGIIEP